MTEAAHSLLGASSMTRWKNCPGSVALCATAPKYSSPYADKGTWAHEIAAEVLLTGKWPSGVSDEDRKFIAVYIDAIHDEWKKDTAGDFRGMNREDRFLVEHKFHLPEVDEKCFGTADVVMWFSRKQILQVWDLKYGEGTKVEVEKNDQLMFYGLGAFNSLKLPAKFVELVIVQPRCEHKDGVIRRSKIPSIELLEFEEEARLAATRTKDPNAPLTEGRWCYFCPARTFNCPLHLNKRKEKAAQLFTEVDGGDLI
jgi:hypothetical protein